MSVAFLEHLRGSLERIDAEGLTKRERLIESPQGGRIRIKTDPYGTYFEAPPGNAAIVCDPRHHAWGDAAWLERRGARAGRPDQPVSIYEVHLASWKRKREDGNRPFTPISLHAVTRLVINLPCLTELSLADLQLDADGPPSHAATRKHTHARTHMQAVHAGRGFLTIPNS